MHQSYGTDFASLNKSTKSILKNPDPRSSLAFSNSIVRKDPSKINTEGLGMNPNLTVEDEYIQNLVKQIHFMDLEIKLMKEKQTQDEALGGNFNFQKIGLREGIAPTDHIYMATHKYKDMKVDMARKKNLLEQELMKEREANVIVKSKLDKLKHQVDELTQRFNNFSIDTAQLENDQYTKLSNEKKNKEDFESEINRYNKNMEKINDEHRRLKALLETKIIDDNFENQKYKYEEKLLKDEEDEKDALIKKLTLEKEEEIENIKKDPNLHRAIESNKIVLEQWLQAERALTEHHHLLLEEEALQSLSIQQKEKEMTERKRLQDEYEKVRNMMEDTMKQNEAKANARLRASESAELKILQGQLEKEMREIKKIEDRAKELDTEYRKMFKIDHHQKGLYETLKAQLAALTEQHTNLSKDIHDNEGTYNNMKHQYETFTVQLAELTELKKKLMNKYREVEDEYITLATAHNYLENNINLEDDMKKINLQDLKLIQETNADVNKNINNFLDSFVQLERFRSQKN
jgi:hypothetical protein